MRCSMSSVSGSDDEPLDPRPVTGLSGKAAPSNAASSRCSPVTGRHQQNRLRPGRGLSPSPVRAPHGRAGPPCEIPRPGEDAR
jgi:hypothetical protein